MANPTRTVEQTVLHVRLDRATFERVAALANENGVPKSTMVRTLVGAAIGDSAARVATREAVMLLAHRKHLLMAAFGAAFREVLLEVVDEQFPEDGATDDLEDDEAES